MYILNIVQHTTTGDIIAPALTYETRDAWKAKYHHEMDYAIANENFLGLSILVTDLQLKQVFYENWIREIPQDEEG